MRKLVLVLFAFAIFVWQPETVYAGDLPKDFMSLEELEDILKSGPANAYFKSVPEGSVIKDYYILIKGIHKEPGLKVIVFTTMHKIAAGMSGSPVYLKGKLVGAVAYGFNNFAKVSWGGIAPIALMHKDRDSSGGEGGALGQFFYEDKLFKPIALGDRSIPESLLIRLDSSRAAVNFLSNGKFVFSSGQSRRTAPVNAARSLKPGMPIMVDLLEWEDQSGEVSSISAVGTITYVDKNSGRIFAFGHPFLGAKKVKYTFRTCKIIGTVFSEDYSYKLAGESSEILGLIDFDSSYGVYGRLSLNGLEKLHNFSLGFYNQGRKFNSFKIRIADNRALVPLIAGLVLGIIGETNGAPLPNEPSTTELEAKLAIKGYDGLESKQLSTSTSFAFGERMIFVSSYEAAVRKFISEIYSPVFFSSFNFQITGVEMRADFFSGKPQELKLVTFNFPRKVVWRENPVLEVLLVSQDNSIALEKRLEIKIDWDKIEEPVYTKETKETEKENEKKVSGALGIFTLASGQASLTEKERQDLFPSYFLGPEDFLQSFSRRLKLANKGFFGRLDIQAKSGLPDAKPDSGESILSDKTKSEQENWHIIEGGIRTRKTASKNLDYVNFSINFPPIPSGYIIDPKASAGLQFEVVK